MNGVYPENVTTTSVSVYPKTQYNPSNGTSTSQGYTFTNRLQIALDNLSSALLSRVLDTAVRNGGNNLTISSVTFSLSPSLSYNKTVAARTEAAADAKSTAQQYAEASHASPHHLFTDAGAWRSNNMRVMQPQG